MKKVIFRNLAISLLVLATNMVLRTPENEIKEVVW